MKKFSSVVLVAVAMSLPAIQAHAQEALIAQTKRTVTAMMKDPESVRFRSVVARKGGIVCGEVNAKNSYGGYTGFSRFIGAGGNAARIENEPDSGFEAEYREFCLGIRPPKPAPYREESSADLSAYLAAEKAKREAGESSK